MMEKIRVSDVDKIVDKENQSFQVLKSVRFSVPQGEIACILGPSGCGKSTLLRIIGGFERADKGSVLIDGLEVQKPSSDVIMVFQDFNQLLPWKTVIDNVTYPLKINKIGGTERERRDMAVSYLNMVGLNDSYNSYPHELSGGMKQKVSLARALAMKPSILLMDEPFGSLDALTRQSLQSLLLDIWKETAVTIIFVTHDVQEAIILGDKIIIMGKGPGRIAAVVPNVLERPRNIGEPGFAKAYEKVYSLLETL